MKFSQTTCSKYEGIDSYEDIYNIKYIQYCRNFYKFKYEFESVCDPTLAIKTWKDMDLDPTPWIRIKIKSGIRI